MLNARGTHCSPDCRYRRCYYSTPSAGKKASHAATHSRNLIRSVNAWLAVCAFNNKRIGKARLSSSRAFRCARPTHSSCRRRAVASVGSRRQIGFVFNRAPCLTRLRCRRSSLQKIADRHITLGYCGMIVRSFAKGANTEDINIVFWEWSDDLPCRSSPSTMIKDCQRIAVPGIEMLCSEIPFGNPPRCCKPLVASCAFHDFILTTPHVTRLPATGNRACSA